MNANKLTHFKGMVSGKIRVLNCVRNETRERKVSHTVSASQFHNNTK